MTSRFNPVIQYLQENVGKDFWGSISIKFQSGIPKIIEEHRTRKLEPIDRNERKP